MILELIEIDRRADKPIYRQIIDQFITQISQGILAAGTQIPGTRTMAQRLQLHRKTVVAAIDELVAQGWLESKAGIGTFVPENLMNKIETLPSMRDRKYRPSHVFVPELLRRSLHLPNEKYHLDDGLPDPRLAPIDEISRAYKTALTLGWKYPKYTYGDPKGSTLLRESMATYLFETRGMRVTKNQIIITRGVTQALYLVIKGFVQPGDKVAVPNLNWESANVNFLFHQAELIKVKVDEEGFDVDHLEKICAQQAIKMVFITPHHQYPTTVIMPAYRRVKLLQLASKFRFYIFEDDYDYDFHYGRHPIMPLASAEHDGSVFYAGSFTKAISPVFRIGYLVGNESQIDFLSRLRRMVDRQGDAILELALAQLLKLGTIQRYLRKNKKIYQARRDCFVQLLKSQLASFASFETPEGGMSLWTHFPSHVDLKTLAVRALNHDLYLQDGSTFKVSDSSINATRLGFASSTEVELEVAVSILRKLIRPL